jgi:outer membrane protein TolC
MSPFIKGLCMGILMLCCNGVFAQHILTLHQALDSMVKHYPSLQIKQSLVKAAEAYTTQVNHERTPALKLMEQFDAGTNNNIPGTIFTYSTVPSVGGGTRNSNVPDVQYSNVSIALLDWELINFGSYKAQDAVASANLTVQQNDLQREMFLLQGAVLSSYFNVLKNYYLVQYSQRAVERIDTIRQAINAYVINGLRPGVDSSTANAELSKARLTLLETSRQLEQSKTDLGLLTGIDTSLITPDTANAFMPNQLALTDGTADVSAYHPLLQYYQSAYRYNLANENAIKKNYNPKIKLLATGWLRGSTMDPAGNFHGDVGNVFTQNRYNYLAGIVVTYNPFDLRKKHDQLAVQQYRTQASEQQYTLQKEQLQAAMQRADVDVTAALRKLNEIPVQLQAATDAYNQRLALYNAGLANIIDVVNVYYVLNRAETDLVLAQDEYRKAIFEKAYARNLIPQLLTLLK